jgi:hypothetical protein
MLGENVTKGVVATLNLGKLVVMYLAFDSTE